MIHSVPRQCVLEEGLRIGGPCLKPADPSISSSGTVSRMVVPNDTIDPQEQCHTINIESSQPCPFKVNHIQTLLF